MIILWPYSPNSDLKYPCMSAEVSALYKTYNFHTNNTEILKGQCVGIKAMQSRDISQLVNHYYM